MSKIQKITPCLWFDTQAEEAAKFYTTVFDNSRIVNVVRYGKAGYEMHRMPAGTAMTVEFELGGQTFTALNGGPVFKFNEAVSLQILCDTQKEVDAHWEKLSQGGDKNAQQCGWLKDRFGLSWQVVPAILPKLLGDPDPVKSGRVMNALLKMKKLDIDALKRAWSSS